MATGKPTMLLDRNLLEAVRAWMFQDALPLWAATGLDRTHGGPIEALTLDATASAQLPYKRTRVTARQLYVYSHADLLGWAGAAAVADHLYAYLVNHCWRGPSEGWARQLTADGHVLDPTPDLYDYAFALFALGWRHKATGEPAALELAHATLDGIERRFRHPGGLGFHAALPPSLPRQQNPHMHLMEAALVLAETSAEQRFLDLAKEIADLFVNRLCPLPQARLREFFDDDWHPAAGPEGRRIEPGHQFEWAWILAQHQKLSGTDHIAKVQALVTQAEAVGVDPINQVTFNAVRDDGSVLDAGSRAWPNTERLKGWIGMHDLFAHSAAPAAIEGSLKLLLERYLGRAPKGAWIDSFDAQGRPNVSNIPTSTLYHIFLAFAEVLRVAKPAA